MRSHLRQGLGALDQRRAAVVSAACSVSLTSFDDASIINACTACMQTVAANLTAELSAAWSKAEAQIAAQAAAGGLVGIEFDAGVTGIENFIGGLPLQGFEDVIVEWLETAFTNLCLEAASITGTTIATGASAGSVLGPVGTLIGTLVGVVIAFIQLLTSGCSVTVTNGYTWSCQNYVGAALPNALSLITALSQSPGGIYTPPGGQPISLIGMTPKWVADTFQIFLANPVWLWVNQQFTGVAQGAAPPGWAGSPLVQNNADTLTQLYYTLPGALEMLNRVQLAAASAMVATFSSKLPFYAAVYGGSERSLNAGMPPGVYAPYTGVAGRAWTPGTYTIDINSMSVATYYSCPNLGTNTNGPTTSSIISTFGTAPPPPTPPGPQTNPSGYMLQWLYPSLSTEQCDMIFAANMPAYQANLAAAQAWLNGPAGPCYPVPADLGTGSPWNLEPPDVAYVLANWNGGKYSTQCKIQPLPPGGWTPPSKVVAAPANLAATSTSTSTAGTKIIKGASVVGGLAAIGVALYAAHAGVSVPTAARTLFSDTKTFVKRRMVRRGGR